MSQLDNLISAYVRLLVFQFKLPKAQQQVAIMAKQFLMDGLPQQVRDAYNPYTAVGPQLDVVAKYIGLPRTIGLPAPLPWFGFVLAAGGGNPNGLISVNDSNNRDVVFYRSGYQGTRNTALSDTSYAFMLALQIILNSSDGTLASIQNYLKALLDGVVTVRDNLDMTLTYQINGALPVDPSVLALYLPKPMGVGINITTADFLITDSGDFLITDTGDKLVTTAI